MIRFVIADFRCSGCVVLTGLLLIAALVNPSVLPATQSGRADSKPELKTITGKASYYGAGFQGRRTASGRKFNKNAFVAAHPRWPFGTIVRVTNLKNKHTVNVEVIDRGPNKRAQRKGVIIDLSTKAARTLGFVKQGIAKVRLDVLAWGERGR